MLSILRSLFKHGGDGHPTYRRGPIYDESGAALLVYEQQTTLPEYALHAFRYGRTVVAGSLQGIPVLGAFRPLPTAPQVYIVKAATVAGLGGIQAGQIVTQPLNNE